MWYHFSFPPCSPTTNWSQSSFPLKSLVTSESFSLQCSGLSGPVNCCWYTNQKQFVIHGPGAAITPVDFKQAEKYDVFAPAAQHTQGLWVEVTIKREIRATEADGRGIYLTSIPRVCVFCVHACECVCVPWASLIMLPLIFDSGFLTDLGSHWLSKLTDQWTQRISCLCLPSTGFTGMATMPNLSTWVLEIELGSSCLHWKHFTCLPQPFISNLRVHPCPREPRE